MRRVILREDEIRAVPFVRMTEGCTTLTPEAFETSLLAEEWRAVLAYDIDDETFDLLGVAHRRLRTFWLKPTDLETFGLPGAPYPHEAVAASPLLGDKYQQVRNVAPPTKTDTADSGTPQAETQPA